MFKLSHPGAVRRKPREHDMRFARESAQVAVHLAFAVLEARGTAVPEQNAGAASERATESTEVDHIVT